MNQQNFTGIKSGNYSAALAVLVAILVMVAGVVGIYAVGNNPDAGWQFAPFIVLSAIGAFLAATDSKWLLPYTIAIWASFSEIRRIVDFMLGQYHAISVISLMPIAVTLCLVIPVCKHRNRLSRKTKQACFFYFCAVAWATLFGVTQNGLPALYESVLFAGPATIVPYLASRRFASSERDILIRSVVIVACVVAAYGWWQFMIAPPWDMFWLKAVHMGSEGEPEPMQFRMFSTIASTGPAAVFLAFAMMPAIANARWRGRFGLLGILLMGSAVAITEVRVAWIVLLLMVGVYLVMSKGRAKAQTLTTVAFAVVCFLLILPNMPGGSTFVNRSQTFLGLQNDDSVQKRVGLVDALLPSVLGNPIGKGMGSTGTGDKLNHIDTNSGGNGSYDNGYLALMQTFGLFGFSLLCASFIKLILIVREQRSSQPNQHFVNLAYAAMVGMAVLLVANQMLDGLGGVLLWTFVGMALGFTPEKNSHRSSNSVSVIDNAPLAEPSAIA